ncbi:recombinase family protein [Sphaerotilus sp.]|uniref:recombinase family protein n=1 Tax=Sphaerotilus sp. TaxID=2093942 RepID=UPI0034E2C3E8
MTVHIAYARCSTAGQSVESQLHALAKDAGIPEFSRLFTDEGVSGATIAAQRPGFAALLAYARDGDVVHVAALDRLGRDAIDVQQTVRDLIARGVRLEVVGVGTIGKGVGEVIVAVLAQLAALERDRIKERTAAGRNAARASLAATGLTHRGKASLGRPQSVDPAEVRKWRVENEASIAATADHFGVSTATVKRACSKRC